MYIKPTYINDGVYHIYNRGVAKQDIFNNQRDYDRFMQTLSFFLEARPNQKLSLTDPENLKIILSSPVSDPLVEILAFCLMPNHFHILARQIKDKGVSTFAQRVFDSYTRYYNTKHDRVGTIYQGNFKAVQIENDEQLLHVSRYVHLNPYVNNIIDNPNDYKWSSCKQYAESKDNRICNTSFILSMLNNSQIYNDFVIDYAEYARDASFIKKFVFEE